MDLGSGEIVARYRFRVLALAMLVGSTVLSLALWAARWVLSRDPRLPFHVVIRRSMAALFFAFLAMGYLLALMAAGREGRG